MDKIDYTKCWEPSDIYTTQTYRGLGRVPLPISRDCTNCKKSDNCDNKQLFKINCARCSAHVGNFWVEDMTSIRENHEITVPSSVVDEKDFICEKQLMLCTKCMKFLLQEYATALGITENMLLYIIFPK